MKYKNLIIDYLTFSTKIDTVDSIKEFLGFADLPFQQLKGRYFYKDRLYFEGINIYYNGFNDDMGICVELSGKGCRNFEQLGTGDYMEVFSYINANKGDLNITRLDISYDDFDKLLDFDYIENEIKKGHYLSRFKKFKVEREYSKNADKRSFCIYFGSKNQSDTLFRMYDKRAEQMRFDIEHWVRFEIQLRNDRANCFLQLLVSGNELGKLFVGVINNYIRFIVPSDTDTNLSRAKTADFWLKFLETFEKVSLYIPNYYYDETKLERFVKQQVSGSIVTFIALFGFNKFRDIINGKSQFNLNPKYELLLQSHGINNIHDLFKSDWWNTYDCN